MKRIYGEWVRAMVESIRAARPGRDPYTQFPEPRSSGGTTSEYAVLRDGHAAFFLQTLERYAAYASADMRRHVPQYHQIPEACGVRKALRYAHSCYRKNLRRWAEGTVSRKRACRSEFAVLCACWALGWGEAQGDEAPSQCRAEMIRACLNVMRQADDGGAQTDDEALIRLIALASEAAYRQSI